MDTIPFESQHQYMVTLHGGDSCMVYLKGSVESLMARCDSIMGADGKIKPLNIAAVKDQVEALALQGQRVLAFASLTTSPNTTAIDHDDLARGLSFLGLQGMIDPPRQEAMLAVHACQAAGIRVKMITGDTALLLPPLPVLPVQALWINMTTAVLLGLALAFEPREPGIMQRSPRTPDTSLLNGELIFRIILVGLLLLFEWALLRGASEAEARTITVNVFAVGQSFYLLNCRSLRYSMFRLGLICNPWIWGGIAAMITAQLLFTYLPLMNQLFHTAPIGIKDWMTILAVGLVIYLTIGVEKRFRQYHEKRVIKYVMLRTTHKC